MWKWLSLIPLLGVAALADQCQITSPLPVPVSISGCSYSGNLPGGSTSYIQNTLSPTTTTQVFAVKEGSFSNTTDAIWMTNGDINLNGSAGTAGQCLQSQGSASVPQWGSCGSGGGGSPGTPLNSVQYNGASSFAGSSLLTFYPSTGTLYNTYGIVAGSLTVTNLTVSSNSVLSNGATFYYNGPWAVGGSIGASGGVLQSGGAGQVPTWAAINLTNSNSVGGTLPAGNLPTDVAYTDHSNTFTSSQTITASNGLGVTYNINVGSMTGSGLTSCSGGSNAVTWNSSTNLFGCNTISGGGGGGSTLGAGLSNGTVLTVLTSSPTALWTANSSQFNASELGGATYYLTLNASSVTLQGPIVSSITAAAFTSLGGLTGNQTITLSGDSSGSGTTAITVTAAPTQTNITKIDPAATLNLGSLGQSVMIASNTVLQNNTTMYYQGPWYIGGSASGSTGNMLMSNGATSQPGWSSLNLAGGGNFVSGRLPSGNLPTDVAYIDVANTFTASQTITAANGLLVNYQVNAGSYTGAGLTSCSGAANAVTWNSSTEQFGCNTISGGGGGSSALGVTLGTTAKDLIAVSSPTALIRFDSSQFLNSALEGSATSFITISYSTNSQTGNYTAVSTDTVVEANCASACTVTLPTAVGISGKRYNIKIVGAGTATIATTSSQTIDGSTTVTPLPNQWADIEVESTGINWEIL
jgi:hypothetical protein